MAQFEHYLVQKDLDTEWDEITRLYDDPSNLSVISDPKLRSLARSMIEQSVDERHMTVYAEVTNVARELAHMDLKAVLPAPASSAIDAIKGLLPIPGFLKK